MNNLTANDSKLAQLVLKQQCNIEAWFRTRWSDQLMSLTSSVDIRNAGFKVAAVDTNLFPAGFNNLSQGSLPLCVQAAQFSFAKYFPNCKKVLIIAENHTRNLQYYRSLHMLSKIVSAAGYEVCVGRIDDDFAGDSYVIDTESLRIYPVGRRGNRLYADDFNPCIILLNRDLSEGIPDILVDLEQAITPPLAMGWHYRMKTEHFFYYQQVCLEFAKEFNLDPWAFIPEYRECRDLNFMEKRGILQLANEVDILLHSIKQRYQQDNITAEPFVVIKANSGTYGMSVMMVKNKDQVLNINRKQRVKMSTSKGNQQVSNVILQEGVHTYESFDNAVAEPVVYLLGDAVVGGFYRVHKNKGIDENLNAPGMEFVPLAFSEACTTVNDSLSNHFYLYGVVARLALLAANKEIQAVSNV